MMQQLVANHKMNGMTSRLTHGLAEWLAGNWQQQRPHSTLPCDSSYLSVSHSFFFLFLSFFTFSHIFSLCAMQTVKKRFNFISAISSAAAACCLLSPPLCGGNCWICRTQMRSLENYNSGGWKFCWERLCLLVIVHRNFGKFWNFVKISL